MTEFKEQCQRLCFRGVIHQAGIITADLDSFTDKSEGAETNSRHVARCVWHLFFYLSFGFLNTFSSASNLIRA